MKSLIPFIALIISLAANAQDICADSSTHFRYRMQFNDSVRITKTILTKDNGKILTGFFQLGNSRGKGFITKINAKGDVAWFKRITAPFGDGSTLFETIAEDSNRNIFACTNSIQWDNRPFFLLVFSPEGNLVNQAKFGLPENEILLSNAAIDISLIERFDADSMLMILNHPVRPNASNGITLVTVSNDGQIGQAVTFVPPQVTSYASYYSKCKISGNDIFLYGGSQFSNTCQINSFDQPAYVALKIDWQTRQITSRKAYCSPAVGSSQFGHPLGEGIDNRLTNVFFHNNGRITYSRRIWGYDFRGGDTVTRIFKITTFDSNFNHLESKYICTPKKFRWTIDWNYELYLDSVEKHYLIAHDILNKMVYYGVGEPSSQFYFQRKLPHPFIGYWGLWYTSMIAHEPGFFPSFNLATSEDHYGYIDNIRILARDTSESCFGYPENQFTVRTANVSPINWQGEFSSEIAPVASLPSNFLVEDYIVQKEMVCNIVNWCDTIRINALDTVCNIDDPIIITAHKNERCMGKVKFVFDTSQVYSFSMLNDTTISLLVKPEFDGKVYAQPENCNKLIDSVTIHLLPPLESIDLGNDTVYCPGKTYVLSVQNTGIKSYVWQDESSDSIFIASQPGIYYVTATDGCGRIYSDTLLITDHNINFDLGNDNRICRGELIDLVAPPGYLSYDWEPEISISYLAPNRVQVQPTSNTSYMLQAEVFNGCVVSDTIKIIVENCPEYIYFPNSFTPNNDGLNEVFGPKSSGIFLKYEFHVYNRWGQKVFMTKNSNEGWNGRYQGKEQPTGVYIWQCKYQFQGKTEKLAKGSFVLSR